jgi:hypothetical protein
MEELRPGLWRWVTKHPGWKPENDTPSGWKEEVASIAVEAKDGRLVLIDPLIRDEAVWRWLGGSFSGTATTFAPSTTSSRAPARRSSPLGSRRRRG